MKGKKKKIGKKGFTLVELLAALVILGMLTIIAAPNILGILHNTKQNVYIDDAKKLTTLAEYKFRGDSRITKPNNGECIVMTMGYLGTSEFKSAPYDGEYSEDASFVVIKRNGNTYEYYTQLIEVDKEGSSEQYRGIPLTKKEEISGDKVSHSISASNLTANPTFCRVSGNYNE